VNKSTREIHNERGGGNQLITGSVVELDDTLTPKCNRQIRKENKFCTKKNQETRIGKMKKLNPLVVKDSIACIILPDYFVIICNYEFLARPGK